MKKGYAHLDLVILLVTMAKVRTIGDCTNNGFMCETDSNCCSLLCNKHGFCHKGYPGTNLDPKEIDKENPGILPGYERPDTNLDQKEIDKENPGIRPGYEGFPLPHTIPGPFGPVTEKPSNDFENDFEKPTNDFDKPPNDIDNPFILFNGIPTPYPVLG